MMDHKPVCNYIVFDFETGGLFPQKHASAEIAMIAINGNDYEELGRVEEIIKPYGEYQYEPKALEINDLTMDKINGGKSVKQVVDSIIKLFEDNIVNKRDGKPTLVGHNVQFDIGFLQQIFAYTKQDLSKYLHGNKDFYGNFQPNFFDTVKLAQKKWDRNKGEIKNYKLRTCCQKARIDLVEGHSAMPDTIATKDLFVYFMNSLQSEGEQNEFRYRTTFEF